MGVTYTIYDATRSLEDELAGDNTLKPIYLNVTKGDGVTRLSLSQDSGHKLYCVSNCEKDNLLEYFSITEEKEGRRNEAEAPRLQESTKRAKQGNLLNFINKK